MWEKARLVPGRAGPGGLRAVRLLPAGRVVLGVVIGAWVAGAALGYDPLLVLAAGGLVALAVAVAVVAWRPRLAMQRAFHPQTVTAGEAAMAVLEVANRSRRPSWPLAAVDRVGAEEVRLPVRALAPGRSALVRYALPTARRGRVPLGPLRAVRSDPLGLLATEADHGGAEVLWVHPRTWPMGALPAGVVVDLEGPISESALQGSLTFSSLREYVPGDDRRQIHWRSTARLGTLMVRQHVDTNEPRATVVLDARPGRWTDESFESGVEVAASVARAFGADGYPVSLHVVGERAEQWRDEGARSLADRLAAVAPAEVDSPPALLSLLEQTVPGGSLVVVSGRTEPSVESRIGAQARRFAPVVLCRVEPGSPAAWRRRGGILVVGGATAPAVADAWNRMLRR